MGAGRLTRRAFLHALAGAGAAAATLSACATYAPNTPAAPTGTRDITVAALLFDPGPGVLTPRAVQDLASAADHAPWFPAWVDGFNRRNAGQGPTGKAIVQPASAKSDIAGIGCDKFETYLFGTPPRLPAAALDLSALARSANRRLPDVLPQLRHAFTGYVVAPPNVQTLEVAPGDYAYPLLWQNLCLLGNLDLLDGLNLPMPDGFAQFEDLQSFLTLVSQATARSGQKWATLEPFSTALPGTFQAIFEAAGGSLSGTADSLALSPANQAALLAYAEVAAHCGRGSISDGTALLAFAWGDSGGLINTIPPNARCKVAALPTGLSGRVLRYVWGLRVGRATPEPAQSTALAFLDWAFDAPNLLQLSVQFGLAPASPDADRTAWLGAFPRLANGEALVAGAESSPSAFLTPLAQGGFLEDWLQENVIVDWSHRADPYGPSSAAALYQVLKDGVPRLNQAIAGTNNVLLPRPKAPARSK